MRQVIINSIQKKFKIDSNLFFLTGDLGFGVVDKIKNNKQFINCGAAEQNMTLTAAGLAIEGNTVVTYSIGNFPSLRCLEQIRNSIVYHNLNVKIISVGSGFSYGALGFTHHAIEDGAIISLLSGIIPVTPSTDFEAKFFFDKSLIIKKPYYFRLSKNSIDLKPIGNIFSIYNPIKYFNGKNCVIFVEGSIITEAIEVRNYFIKKYNFPISIYSVPVKTHLKKENLIKIFSKYKLVITLEENTKYLSLKSIFNDLLNYKQSKKLISYYITKNYFDLKFGSENHYRTKLNIDSLSVIKAIKKIFKF